MKRRMIKLIAAVCCGTVVTFTACTKDDGAIPNRVNIEDVPAVTTNLETGAIADSIAFKNQAIFNGKMKVAMYFAGATPPTKVDIVVRKNGSAANVKLFKADINSFPTNFAVTASQITALFGDTLKLKDTYDFAPDIYANGKKYEAFPPVSLGSGQGISGMSAIGFGEFVRFTVK